MHALIFILIYCSLKSFSFLIEPNSDTCFKSHGQWTDEPYIKSEYWYLKIYFWRVLKSQCKKGPLKLTWLKDNHVIKTENLSHKRTHIRSKLEFYSLSKSDAGNYTLHIVNDVLNYQYNVTLLVSDASDTLRTLRQQVAPPRRNLVQRGRLYWMPIMIESQKIEIAHTYRPDSLRCRIFSADTLDGLSVSWSVEDGSGGLLAVSTDSRVFVTTAEARCDLDNWMPLYGGYCYESVLHFEPFLSSDSGQYVCKVTDYLQASFILAEKVSGFEPRFTPLERKKVHESLRFNGNETVCSGSAYLFNCSSSLGPREVTVILLSKAGFETTLTSSNNSLALYSIPVTQGDDSGHYMCRGSNVNPQQMYLMVRSCLRVPLLLSIAVPSAVLVFLVVVVLLYLKLWRLHMRQRTMSKIEWFSKLEGMYRNERYIPLHTDPNWEIPLSDIVVSSQVLGVGHFGKVLKGRFGTREVALKVSRPGGETVLQEEIEVMKQLGRHEHIIQLLGVCSLECDLMAVLELADRDNLREYLREHNPALRQACEPIGLEQLLLFVIQVADGMVFLSSKNVVHRDLAARNCLLTTNMTVKLSDFGLTRFTSSSYVNDHPQQANPVAWMAPESLSTNVFTSKSDVWSFGVLMWEVFELGACPYPGLSLADIREAVGLGQVNPKPPLASDEVYAIMMACWAMDSTSRPSFLELKAHLDEAEVNEYL